MAPRDGNGIKDFPLACCVVSCELQSLSSAIKMHQNFFVSEPLFFPLSPDVLMTGTVRGKGGGAGFWRLAGVMMQYVVAHSLSVDVFFFFVVLFLSRTVL